MLACSVVRPYSFLRLVQILTLLTLATPTIVCSPLFTYSHLAESHGVWSIWLNLILVPWSSLWRCQVSAARNRRGPVLLAASWPVSVDWRTWPRQCSASTVAVAGSEDRFQPLGFRLVRWKEASGAEVVCTCSTSSQQKLPHNKKNMTSIVHRNIWNHPTVCQVTLLAPNNCIWNATPSCIGLIRLWSCHSLFPRTLSFFQSALRIWVHRKQPTSGENSSNYYCWWKKSCITWDT